MSKLETMNGFPQRCAHTANLRTGLLVRGVSLPVALLLLIGGSLQAQSLECVSELMVPRYNLSSRRSTTGGSVLAIVTVGTGGHAAKIDLDAADPDLAAEVRVFLTGSTKYAENCAGKKVEMRFTFRLEGDRNRIRRYGCSSARRTTS
jgi:hypothetical protein